MFVTSTIIGIVLLIIVLIFVTTGTLYYFTQRNKHKGKVIMDTLTLKQPTTYPVDIPEWLDTMTIWLIMDHYHPIYLDNKRNIVGKDKGKRWDKTDTIDTVISWVNDQGNYFRLKNTDEFISEHDLYSMYWEEEVDEFDIDWSLYQNYNLGEELLGKETYKEIMENL